MEVGMIRFRQTGEIFSDIYAAREAVLSFAEKADSKKHEKAELIFDEDYYVLQKPLVFDAKATPALANIAISFACEDGEALFTSERALDRKKLKKNGNYYSYPFEADENGEFPRVGDFYVDGRSVSMCRSVSYTHVFTFEANKERLCEENLEGIYIPEDAAESLPAGDFGSLEMVIHMEWEFFVLHPVDVDRTRFKYDENGNKHVLLKIKDDELYEYVKGVNGCLQPKNREFYFRNHPLFLKKDSFCYDHHTGTLCYFPAWDFVGACSVPCLEQIFCIEGMDGVSFENLYFTCISEAYVGDHGYFSHQANIEKRTSEKLKTAAVFTRGVSGLSVKNCRFTDMNANGILMVGSTARVTINGCRFEDIGMSAISIGDPICVGRDKKACSYAIQIENNLLRRIGFAFPSAPAIQVFRVDGLSVCHNTIEYCAYSGISVGWEWGLQPYALGEMVNIRDAEIAYNRILHHMQILNDGGAVYVVGCNSAKQYQRYFNFMHDNFAFREEPRRTVRGYYLDGSSTNWHVYDNVTLGTHRPMFAQFIVPTEYTWNIRMDDTYTTDKVHEENHAPERNTLLGSVYYAPTMEALFAEYPKAKEIFDRSGCSSD